MCGSIRNSGMMARRWDGSNDHVMIITGWWIDWWQQQREGDVESVRYGNHGKNNVCMERFFVIISSINNDLWPINQGQRRYVVTDNATLFSFLFIL